MRIVVVGAGPAGTTLSLLLARHGADVRLLEREPAIGSAFRGEGLLPLGLDALQQMGLGRALRDVPGRVVARWRIYIDGEEALTVPEPVADLGEQAFRIISPAALLTQVIRAAEEFPTFSFHPDTRFTDVIRDADDRVVGVHAATGARRWRGPPTSSWAATAGVRRSVRTAGSRCSAPPRATTCCGSRCPPRQRCARRCEFLIMVRARCHPMVAYLSRDDRL